MINIVDLSTVGIVKRGIRAVWDAFMFHAVIKKRARIPASDSFIARRIAGPGLAANYFYQVGIVMDWVFLLVQY